MKKNNNRYGKLTATINELYAKRKVATNAGLANEASAVQMILNVAFNIAYNRPVEENAVKELVKHLAKTDIANTNMDLLAAMLEDAKEHFPEVVSKIQTYILFS